MGASLPAGLQRTRSCRHAVTVLEKRAMPARNFTRPESSSDATIRSCFRTVYPRSSSAGSRRAPVCAEHAPRRSCRTWLLFLATDALQLMRWFASRAEQAGRRIAIDNRSPERAMASVRIGELGRLGPRRRRWAKPTVQYPRSGRSTNSCSVWNTSTQE